MWKVLRCCKATTGQQRYLGSEPFTERRKTYRSRHDTPVTSLVFRGNMLPTLTDPRTADVQQFAAVICIGPSVVRGVGCSGLAAAAQSYLGEPRAQEVRCGEPERISPQTGDCDRGIVWQTAGTGQFLGARSKVR